MEVLGLCFGFFYPHFLFYAFTSKFLQGERYVCKE